MHNRPSKEGSPLPLPFAGQPPTSLSWQNLPPPIGILRSPSQPPAIPQLSPALPLRFHFPLNLGPTLSLEEPGDWPGEAVTPAYFRGGLELAPSLPGPLAVAPPGPRSTDVYGVSPQLSFSHAPPRLFLSLSPVSSIKTNVFDSHFIVVLIPECAYQWAGHQGIGKGGSSSESLDPLLWRQETSQLNPPPSQALHSCLHLPEHVIHQEAKEYPGSRG